MATSLTRGMQLFDGFLEQHGLTLRAAAEALGVSDVAVLSWRRGSLRPGPDMRLRIERWTGGAITVASWLTDEEAASIQAVVPFAPAPATVAA